MPIIIVRLLAITAFSIVSLNFCYADTVHKCKNAQGKLMYQKTPCTEQEVSSWTPKMAVKSGESDESTEKKTKPIVIRQSRNGHYFVNAEVNSHSFMFVVDTGASTVALPPAVAKAASMFCNDKVLMDTANGLTQGCSTIITELKLNEFVFKNVAATISPNLKEPLLGMNVLQRFDIEQKNGEMRLSERETRK